MRPDFIVAIEPIGGDVADTNNHRVVLLDSNGQHLFSLGRAPTFAFIQKVALDAQRRLFIADSDRNSIIAFLGRDARVPFDGWIRDYVGDAGAQPSDPRHLEGTMQGRVENGPLSGCELRANYSADYGVGGSDVPSQWRIEGAIVCECAHKMHSVDLPRGRVPFSALPGIETPGPASPAKPRPPALAITMDETTAVEFSRKQFNEWDRDGDGRLSREEFIDGAASSTLGILFGRRATVNRL